MTALRSLVSAPLVAAALPLAALLFASNSFAQSCPADAVGCASGPLSFQREVGLPFSFDIDTGWVPSGSPVQVRFVAALVGRTQVRADGTLRASWPTAMRLEGLPTAGSGTLLSDYGVQLDARVRLDLGSGATFEGSIPYVPHIDFRMTGQRSFDPWAWEPVSVTGMTARQHLADVPITAGLVSIPGISGGLSFDAAGTLNTSYQSLALDFGGDANPITATVEQVHGLFTAGPSVTYFPQLQGTVRFSAALHVYPSLYVELLGRRYMLDLADIPIPIGPFDTPWNFDRNTVALALPDVVRNEPVVDFGRVTVGTTASDGVPLETAGTVAVWFHAPADQAPFSFSVAERTVPAASRAALPVSFSPTAVGPIEVRLPMRTSDPDTPSLFVTLRGEGVAPPVDVVVTDASEPAEAERDGQAMPPSDAGSEDSSARGDGSSEASLQGYLSGSGTCACRATPGAPSRSVPTSRGALLAGLALCTVIARRARRW